jgi:hypothetical protein
LRNWAIETINRKLKNGLSFDLKRRGLFTGQDADDPEPAVLDDEIKLSGDYL